MKDEYEYRISDGKLCLFDSHWHYVDMPHDFDWFKKNSSYKNNGKFFIILTENEKKRFIGGENDM